MDLELVKTFIEYHIETTRRVWGSIEHITEEQFLADDEYSRGSIRNLMIHITSTDRRWLAGLKNQTDVGHLNADAYSNRDTAREAFLNTARDLADYVSIVTEEDLHAPTKEIGEPSWQVLLHLVNHGTDHRATVLQKLYDFGAPTFAQDFIIWLWERK